jgi:prevent-host-death family protein
MIDLTEIRSVSDFQRNAKEYVGKLKESKNPLVLTVNGRAELVVQDAASYQTLLNRLEELESRVQFEAIAAIRIGLQQASEGKVKPARGALRQLGDRLGL